MANLRRKSAAPSKVNIAAKINDVKNFEKQKDNVHRWSFLRILAPTTLVLSLHVNADEHRCFKIKKVFICVHLRLSVEKVFYSYFSPTPL